MTCLPIAEMGELILRQVAQSVPVEEISTPAFQTFLADLIETLRDRKGVGIAAPQVFRSVRVIAIEACSNPRYPDIPDIPLKVLINPEILEQSPLNCSFVEGCLSVPEQRGEVHRPEWVRVAAYNAAGQREEYLATDFTARILLHEIDHLNGILFVDRLVPNPVESSPVGASPVESSPAQALS